MAPSSERGLAERRLREHGPHRSWGWAGRDLLTAGAGKAAGT